MKDLFFDLVYNWKHALSSDNTKGTRVFLWVIFVFCIILVVSGFAGIIVAIITHKITPVITGLIVLAAGIGIFAFVSTR